jgi:hypothetical protein
VRVSEYPRAPECAPLPDRRIAPRLVLLIVAVWLASWAVFALLIVFLDQGNQRSYGDLKKNGAPVLAIVTATAPSNHDTVYYSFKVNGRRYSTGDFSLPPNPDATHLVVGGHVYVTYDRRNPTISCACDPFRAAAPAVWWRRALVGIAGGSVWAIIITIAILRRANRPTDGERRLDARPLA